MLAPILSDLISIQIPALHVVRYYLRVREGGDIPKQIRVFGLKKLFSKRFFKMLDLLVQPVHLSQTKTNTQPSQLFSY